MLWVGIAAAVIGNGMIGIGQCLQKYGLNQLPSSGTTLNSGKRRPVLPHSPPPIDTISPPDAKDREPTRLSNKFWVLGFLMCYTGELMGNWIGMANASVAIVSPLGILAVVINAVLAERFLNERMGPHQRKAYAWVAGGVLLILLGAPRNTETSLSGRVKTVQDWVQMMSDSDMSSMVMLLGVVEVGILYQIVIRNRHDIQMYVGSTAVFGSLAILSSNALTVLLKVMAVSESAAAAEGSSVNGTLVNTKHVHHTQETSPGPTLFVLIITLLSSSIAQEIMKQQSYSRFPVSKFQPMLYAVFNILGVLSNMVVFREVTGGVVSWMYFLMFFGLGIVMVYEGILMMREEDQQEAEKTS